MPTSEIISVSGFLFFLVLVRVGGYTCNESRCQPGGPTIRFPFYLTTQNKRCGYSGFQLSCNHLNQTILHLKHSGDFVVDYINYDSQTILVRDPDGCLPERLFSLSLDGSPFAAEYNLNFTFLKCPRKEYWSLSDVSLLDVSIVRCLSDALNIVVATTANLFIVQHVSTGNCSMWTANIPVSPQSKIMWLKWDMEFCQICQSKGKRCKLKGYSGSVLECYGNRQGLSRGSKCAILAGVVMPCLLFLVGVAFYLSSKANRPMDGHGLPPPPPTDVTNIEEGVHRAMTRGILSTDISVTRGIELPTLESYPKTQLDEDGMVPRPDHDVCAICLSEYKGRETIRTLPECSHYFHAGCIDPWLKRNGACPICRTQNT